MLEYDESIGWYDPEIAYCINGDGNLAVAEEPYGMYEDNMIVELLCYECKAKLVQW